MRIGLHRIVSTSDRFALKLAVTAYFCFSPLAPRLHWRRPEQVSGEAAI